MKDVIVLLTEETKIARFLEEVEPLHFFRDDKPLTMRDLWFVCGQMADWTGFMDDYGDFIPVDWC